MVQTVVDSNPGLASQGLEISCQPSSNWVPFSNQKRKRQGKERDKLHLLNAVSKIQKASNPTAFMTTRSLEIFTFHFEFYIQYSLD